MQAILNHYLPRFDFPRRDRGPDQTIMLASVPRSGSTYFAIRLWQAAVFGAPMEYLNFPYSREMFGRMGVALVDDEMPNLDEARRFYAELTRVRTSPNGVFGYKMFVHTRDMLTESYAGLLPDMRPDVTIFLTRNDTLGQAISWSKALRSDHWFADGGETAELDYDGEHIRECMEMIEDQQRTWESIFVAEGIEPIRVSYEDFLRDEAGVIAGLSSAIGVEAATGAGIEIPSIQQQRNATSTSWRRRFLNEAAGCAT